MGNERSLAVTYRHGKAFAAYLSLPGRHGKRVVRSCETGKGFVVDYSADGKAVGIEIISPKIVTVEAINDLLLELNEKAISKEELAPLESR